MERPRRVRHRILKAAVNVQYDVDDMRRFIKSFLNQGSRILEEMGRAEHFPFRLDARFFISTASCLEREGEVFIIYSWPPKLATIVVASSVHLSAPASIPLSRSLKLYFPGAVKLLPDHIAVDTAPGRVVDHDVAF